MNLYLNNFKIYLLLLILILQGCSITEHEPTNSNNVETIFEIIYNTNNTDYFFGAMDIIEVDEGGYLVVGKGNWDIFLLRLDEYGSIIWEQTYDNTESACTLLETSDGGFVVGGRDNYYSFIFKTDENGEVLWESSIELDYDRPVQKIIETISGDLIFFVNSYAVNIDSELIKMSMSGDIIWQTSLNNVGYTRFISHFENSNEELMVLGSNTLEGETNYWLSYLDQEGNELTRTDISSYALYFVQSGKPSVVIDNLDNFVGCGNNKFITLGLNGNLILQNNLTPNSSDYDEVDFKSIIEYNDVFLITGSLLEYADQGMNSYGAVFNIDRQGNIVGEIDLSPSNCKTSEINAAISTRDGSIVTAGFCKGEGIVYGSAWIKKIRIEIPDEN